MDGNHELVALLGADAVDDLADGEEVELVRRDGRRVTVQVQRRTSASTDELARTARTLELVLEQVPAMYYLADASLKFLASGGATARILGYPSGSFIGRNIRDVPAIEPASIDMHLRALRGETINYRIAYSGKHLAVTVAPYRRDGEIVAVIGTAIDVTSVHQLERRMVDAQRAESLGVLAGGLAHDFNNLLVAILGNADLGLRDVRPGAPGRTSLENIRNASLRAAELTDQLLAYAGHGGVGHTRVAPREVVDELLRITAATIPANVHVDVDIAEALAIRGDAAQIRQVLLNLIGNAREALGAAGGRVSVRGSIVQHDGEATSDDIITASAGAYAMLDIEDTGHGMDADTRRRIFEPFFTTKSTGHGLGLAAVLGIVRAHGGGLRVISTPGQGARFVVLWPATFTPAEMVAATEPTPRTVLVIDDEDLVRDVLARMVEDLGYAAVTAPDGAEGLAIVDAQQIDAVLVDLTMPRMSGGDVVTALRARHPAIPVILCTGYDFHRKGPVFADAYLPKPFRMDALERTLAQVLAP